MSSDAGPGHTLATRLRELREKQWPDMLITQRQLASALGVSVPLISSWESDTNPKLPPPARLAAYATFFATRRSIATADVRLLNASELTPDERQRQEKLLDELTRLRAAAHGGPVSPGGTWHFPPEQTITIVCSELPGHVRETMARYTDPTNPDFVELYAYSDLDALVELYGHLRAANPRSQVNFRVPSAVVPDDYSTHLVLLGGVDWNLVTRDVLTRIELPVRQATRPIGPEDAEETYFEVVKGGQRHAPVLAGSGDAATLLVDVCHFYRGPSPYDRERTVTICNGMYGRGVLGAVRTLTDSRFRDRNEAYLNERFPDRSIFSILTRVPVVHGKVVTPDWTEPGMRLHEWPAT
jgi:transcriptional regulator with XRE-family HTH domain